MKYRTCPLCVGEGCTTCDYNGLVLNLGVKLRITLPTGQIVKRRPVGCEGGVYIVKIEGVRRYVDSNTTSLCGVVS